MQPETVSDYESNYGNGWIKFYRTLMEHPVIGFKKPLTKAEAWIWMLCEARFEDTKEWRNFGGKERLIDMPAGTLSHSLRFISGAWGWSIKKIKTFLKVLENEKQIAQNVTQQITQISILNYGIYQGKVTQQVTQQGNSKGTAREQTKELKELKEYIYTIPEVKHEKHDLIIQMLEQIKTEYPNIKKLTQQMTYKDAGNILDKYPGPLIKNKLDAMENMKTLSKKYVSVYRTLDNWCRLANVS